MPRPRRAINHPRAALNGAKAPAESTDYSAMSTKALRLRLGECHIQQAGNRRERISRQQQNEQQRPPAPQSESGPSNSSVATGVPNVELAALISSIVDEWMHRQLTIFTSRKSPNKSSTNIVATRPQESSWAR